MTQQQKDNIARDAFNRAHMDGKGILECQAIERRVREELENIVRR